MINIFDNPVKITNLSRNQQRLTVEEAYDDYPSFSPDSREIVFTWDRDGDLEKIQEHLDATQGM